jgi:hypothetical protein
LFEFSSQEQHLWSFFTSSNINPEQTTKIYTFYLNNNFLIILLQNFNSFVRFIKSQLQQFLS